MKISTVTSVFINYSLFDAAEKVIEAGFDAIDLWCGRPHLYRKDYSAKQIKDLSNTLSNAGLRINSLFPAFYRYPYSLSNPNPIVRKDSINYVIECVDNAVLAGAKQVLIVPTHSLVGQKSQDALLRFTDSLNRICSHTESTGIELGIEVLNPNLSDFMYLSEHAVSVINQIGSHCLKAVLDTGHTNLSGESFPKALQTIGDLLIQVHVNDNDGSQQQNAIPGSGTFNFKQLGRDLKNAGYDDYLTLELGAAYSADPFPAVCESIEKIKNYLST